MDYKLIAIESPEFGKMNACLLGGIVYYPATACAKAMSFANPHDAVQRNCPNRARITMDVETGQKSGGPMAIQKIDMDYITEADLRC